jgi:S1-C subfamily serine protease
MNEAVPETYILPVPGSDQTQELPRGAVLERIARGEIAPTDWIWSPADQDWKTVSEIPSLQPSLPKSKKSFFSPLGPVGAQQKIEPILAPSMEPPPKKKKKVKPKRQKSEDDGESSFSWFGSIACLLILALFAVIVANYQFVDRPFDGNMARTPFILVPAHAHLGAFFQTDKLVIHVLPTNELDSSNFADFLYSAANGTPAPPFGSKAFSVVELTPSWRGQYAFSGADWQKLGQMTSSSSDARKDFVLDHIDDPTGQPLVAANAESATRNQIWQNLVQAFHSDTKPGSFVSAGTATSILDIATSLISKVSSMLPHDSSSSTPASPPPNNPENAAAHAPKGTLTDEQTRAVVVIKGDAGGGMTSEGTGFLVQMPDGPVVVTNLHVVAGSANLKIITSSGEEIKILSLRGATDRDLAMFSIVDNRYSYLSLASDVDHTVQSGDATVVPGNSEGGEVTLNTSGTVVGVGPQKVEISNPVYHGNSGSPIIATKDGKVIGVVTYATKNNPSDPVDQASFANPNSAITGSMRYFGFRLDNVPQWETYDQGRFLDERRFLLNFAKETVALDSLLNGKSSPAPGYYLTNEKLKTAIETFRNDSASSSDPGMKANAEREFLFTLQNMADDGVGAIQNNTEFYTFDRSIAQQLAAYRQRIKEEVQNLGDRINHLGI